MQKTKNKLIALAVLGAISGAAGAANTSTGTQATHTGGTSTDKSKGSSTNDSVGMTRSVPLHVVISRVLMENPSLEPELFHQEPRGYFALAGNPPPPSFDLKNDGNVAQNTMNAAVAIRSAWCLEASIAKQVTGKSYASVADVSKAVVAAAKKVAEGDVDKVTCTAMYGTFGIEAADPVSRQGFVTGVYDTSNPYNAPVAQNIWNLTMRDTRAVYRLEPSASGFLLKRGGMVLYGDGALNGERVELAISNTRANETSTKTTTSHGRTTGTVGK